jgi:hypothetical protein
VLRSPSGEVVDSVGPQLLSSQELDILPMVNRFVLGYDGKEARFAWECFELECGSTAPLPVRVVAVGRRKMRKHLGLLCLGLGLGFPGLGSRLVGPVAGLISGSVGLVFRSASGSSVFSRPDLVEVPTVTSMEVNEQI